MFPVVVVVVVGKEGVGKVNQAAGDATGSIVLDLDQSDVSSQPASKHPNKRRDGQVSLPVWPLAVTPP